MSKPRNTPGYRAGDWLIVSGQTGRVGEALVPGGFAAEFVQALANVERIVDGGGLALHDIAKVNIYLASMGDYARMNEIYAQFFGDHLPARTTVAVSGLNRGAAVEVEAWAFAQSRDTANG
jgi:2-iminobutanoate/2-iminopropanoate deaminase